MKILCSVLMLQSLLFVVIKGQCWSNGTCTCHCVDCNKTCTKCSSGWSGSTTNKCQRANILYQSYGENNGNSQILDGDLNTSEKSSYIKPFVRVKLRQSTKINKVDVTLLLEHNATYKFVVKEEPYVETDDVICDKFVHTGTEMKTTLTLVCRKPLKGQYLEIVSSRNTALEVFEIEQFECHSGTYGNNCSKICPPGCDKDCDKVSGNCVCRNGFHGPSCKETCSQFCGERGCDPLTGDCYECKNGFYGIQCQINCSRGCLESCNKVSGSCSCRVGFYSVNCSMQCPPTCVNDDCDQTSGKCLSCNHGYYGSYCNYTCLGKCDGRCDRSTGLCKNCSKNFYGRFCNNTCPSNCEDNSCDRIGGNCENCKKGYKGYKCNDTCPNKCQRCSQSGINCEVCEDGYFDLTCTQKCPPSCGGNGSCDIALGHCHVCSTGMYGSQCNFNCSTYCDLDGECDKDTGKCRRCIPGRYGRNCSEQCSTHCLNSTCFRNETCVHGCTEGWFGKQCNEACDLAFGSCTNCIEIEENNVECLSCDEAWFLNGSRCFQCPENCFSCLSQTVCNECKKNAYFGLLCETRCHSACIHGTCDINGTCLHGCDNSKYGTQCDQSCLYGCKVCKNSSECEECFSGFFGKTCEACQKNCKVCRNNMSCDVCAIGWTNRTENCKDFEKCSKINRDEICAKCDRGYYGLRCEKNCNRCINLECDVRGNCDIGCNSSTKYDSEQCGTSERSDDPNLNFLAGIASISIILLISIVLFIQLKWKHRRKIRTSHDAISLTMRNDNLFMGYGAENNELSLYSIRGSQALLVELDSEEDIEDLPVSEIQNHNYLNVKISRIFTNTLWEFTLKNKANDYLKKEFQEIPEGLLLECRIAKKAVYKKLNRYKHIYPYDTTRVVLNVENESNTGDYINASYVNGLEKPREYIAAQGPFTNDTINDFWRMIWQLSANTIVILTNLEENKIMKCKKYWPKSEIMYGDVHVKTDAEEFSTLFTVRRFKLVKEGEERTIEQFHFTAWPDKGVPRDVNSILEFRHRIVSKKDISGPLVVHCSAGIGRTGSFIAIDYLIKQGQRDGSVDVVSCVSRIRHQRAHAIQTVEQYIYLYDVITKELTGRQSALLKDEFRNYFSQLKSVNPRTGKQHIEEEFQLIEKLTPTFDEKRYENAKAVNNLSKNRHNNVLPDDNYRLYLSRGESDYINAIQLPDAQRPFGYILTQTPLPNTVGDFLSLVADHEVLSIVMFEHDQEETVGVYLPNKEGPILCDSFELFLHDQSELGDTDVLNLKFYDKQTEDARFINVFRGHFWKQNRLVPEHHQPMIDLIEAVLNLRKEHSGHPVLVHCMNGAKQSGMFCVLANLVEQIQLFGTVDILQTVVNMRHRRIQIVPCLAQLEYIYNFVENYLKSIGENRFNV